MRTPGQFATPDDTACSGLQYGADFVDRVAAGGGECCGADVRQDDGRDEVGAGDCRGGMPYRADRARVGSFVFDGVVAASGVWGGPAVDAYGVVVEGGRADDAVAADG